MVVAAWPDKRQSSAGRFNREMPTRRRSRGRIQLGLRLAVIVKDGRQALRWSKSELGFQSGVSRQMVGEIEAARANASLDVIAALLEALGITLELLAKGPVVIDARRHDAAHAICSAYVQRRLEALGWLVAREVRIEQGRYLGWIDLLAFHEATGTLLVIEVKTRLDDAGAIERSMDWHMSTAMRAARRLGWHPKRLTGWLLALATAEVDDALRRTRTIWDRAFPKRAAELALTIADPSVADGRGLALIDPRSRRRDWLIRARIDGRRSRSAYVGYADFMRHAERST